MTGAEGIAVPTASERSSFPRLTALPEWSVSAVVLKSCTAAPVL